MKKLLSTTAILSAFAFAGAANAADLQVNVGGFLDFQAGYTNDDIVGETGGAPLANEVNFNNDSEIHFTVDGKADNGLEYGAVVELEADINAGDQAQDGGANADKTYLFMQGGWGRVELGGNTDASEALSINSSTFASATGGTDGDFYRYTAAPASFTGIIRPNLVLAEAGNGAVSAPLGLAVGEVNEDATKITYYSPRFAGFQAGISYAPNSGATGVTGPGAVVTGGYNDVFAAGLNYAAQWDAIGFKAALTGQTADAIVATDADLQAWDIGANVNFAGFTVGGSYGDLNDSLGIVTANTDSSYWDAGVGYEAGAFSASATYLNSEGGTAAADDEFDNLVVGVDYKLAPGLTPYAEVSFFNFDGAGAGVANDNEGTVVILGTELAF